jgi:hypothetical protein
MLERTNHESIVPICGGNAETDLLALVVGQFVDEAWGGQGSGLPAADERDGTAYT